MPTTVSFGGNPQQLLQAYNQIYAANVKMQQQLQQMANQQQQHAAKQQQHAHQHSNWLEHQFGSLKNMAAGYLTVHAAMHTVTNAYEQHEERLKAIGEKYRQYNAELVRNIALSAQAANAPQITAALQSMPGVSRDEASKAYFGVSSTTTSRDQQRILGLTAAAAGAAKAIPGIDLAEHGGFVGLTGDLAPGRNTQQVGDLALSMRQRLGNTGYDRFDSSRRFPQIQRLVDSGAFSSTEQALGWAVEAAQRNPELIGQMLEGAVDRRYEKPHHSKGMPQAEYQARKQLFEAKSPAERRALIESNAIAANLAGVDASGLKAVRADAAAANAAAFSASGGTTARMQQAVAATRGGRQLQAERSGSMELSAAERKYGRDVEAEEVEAAQQALEKVLQGHHPISATMNRWGFKTARVFHSATNFLPGMRPPLINALAGQSPEAATAFIEERNRVEGYEKYDSSGRLTAEALNRLVEGQREQTEAIKQGFLGAGHAPAPVTTNKER